MNNLNQTVGFYQVGGVDTSTTTLAEILNHDKVRAQQHVASV